MDRAEQLRVELLASAERYGEVDANGHRSLDVETPITVPGGKTYAGFTREKRTKRVVSEERVRELAAEKGLTDRIFKQVTIEVFDEDELYACYQEDLISDAELDALIEETVTFALKAR